MPHRRKSLKERRGQAWPTGAHGRSEVLAILQGCCRGCSAPTARGSGEPDSPLWQRPLSSFGWWDMVSETQVGCPCILPQNPHRCYYLEEQYYHQKVNNLKFHKLNSLKTPEIIIDFQSFVSSIMIEIPMLVLDSSTRFNNNKHICFPFLII